MMLDRLTRTQPGSSPSALRPFWFRTWMQRFASSSDIERLPRMFAHTGQPNQAVPFLRPDSVDER